jgi:hypothetical protein
MSSETRALFGLLEKANISQRTIDINVIFSSF